MLALAVAGHARVRETAGAIIDPDQEIAAVRLARATAQTTLQRGEEIDLDVVMLLAAAGHHDQAAVHELITLALALNPGQKIVDVGEHRLWGRSRFGHDAIINLHRQAVRARDPRATPPPVRL